MDFQEIVKLRYATKRFNGKKIPQKLMEKLLEMGRYSASSYGLQPYKIKVITDQKTKEKLKISSRGQEQVSTCSHLLVICADLEIEKRIEKYGLLMRKNKYPKEEITKRVEYMKKRFSSRSEEEKKFWAQKQCYILLGNLINGAKALGFDSCPMEGFEPSGYSKILKLPSNLIPTLVVPAGYAADQKKPKIRFTREELFF